MGLARFQILKQFTYLYNDVGKQKALSWIEAQGYDINDYEVIYRQEEYGVSK